MRMPPKVEAPPNIDNTGVPPEGSNNNNKMITYNSETCFQNNDMDCPGGAVPGTCCDPAKAGARNTWSLPSMATAPPRL